MDYRPVCTLVYGMLNASIVHNKQQTSLLPPPTGSRRKTCEVSILSSITVIKRMKLSLVELLILTSSCSGFVVPSLQASSKAASHGGSSSFGRLFAVLEEQAVSAGRTHKAPVFDEVCETTGVTLKRFMTEVAMLNPELQELTALFGAIDTSCKAIANVVKRSQLPSSSVLGYQGAVNVQGEDQKKLDVITNDLLKRALRFTGRLGVLASEEEDTPVALSEGESATLIMDETQRYVAVFDPLDGSSNVDAGIPTGTIIGIYDHDEMCEIPSDFAGEVLDEEMGRCLTNTLQPGTNLVAAAYCLYSSSTFFVLTLGNGVYMFTLDEQLGEFVLSKPNVKIPEVSSIISMNEANIDMWDEPLKNVVKGWRNGTGRSGKRFSSRYIGSMVGDVHRTLLYGGVFGYPGDKKNVNGKLRLLYEGAPMSFIMEQAGGLSTTGRKRVMEITPEIVHQRVPMMMGSKNDIQEVVDAYAAWDKK